jgi:radical SAM protein with 4Fe4S-binding SPASM domain
VDAISNCSHATARMVVAANGKILLCTQDYDGDFDLGNLLDDNSTVESLWNNNDYLKIRNSIVNKTPPNLCTNRCIIFNPGY